MASIENLNPVPHPAQPDVTLSHVGIEGLSLTSGTGIDAPARMVVRLRPFAPVRTADDKEAFLLAPAEVPEVELVIPDVVKLVAERAALGDMVPFQALELLKQAIGGEYARRNGG